MPATTFATQPRIGAWGRQFLRENRPFLRVIVGAQRGELPIEVLLQLLETSTADWVVGYLGRTKLVTTAYCPGTNVMLRSLHEYRYSITRLKALPNVHLLERDEIMPARFYQDYFGPHGGWRKPTIAPAAGEGGAR